MTIKDALLHPLFADIRNDYQHNMDIKGEPISMELEGMDIEQIRSAVEKEYKYYQDKKMG